MDNLLRDLVICGRCGLADDEDPFSLSASAAAFFARSVRYESIASSLFFFANGFARATISCSLSSSSDELELSETRRATRTTGMLDEAAGSGLTFHVDLLTVLFLRLPYDLYVFVAAPRADLSRECEFSGSSSRHVPSLAYMIFQGYRGRRTNKWKGDPQLGSHVSLAREFSPVSCCVLPRVMETASRQNDTMQAQQQQRLTVQPYTSPAGFTYPSLYSFPPFFTSVRAQGSLLKSQLS